MGQTPNSVTRGLRLAVANSIIAAIASCGRRFLSANSDMPGPLRIPHPRLSRFALVNGRLWYVDKWKEARIFAHFDPPARRGWGFRFSDGGTLLSLMKHLRDFIVTGAPINVRYFGPFHAECCGGDPWGYGKDMPVLKAKVQAILAQWDKDQEYCCASCGGDREVETRTPVSRQYGNCAACGTLAIMERAVWQQRKEAKKHATANF